MKQQTQKDKLTFRRRLTCSIRQSVTSVQSNMSTENILLEDLGLSLKDVEQIVKKHFCERGGKFHIMEVQVNRLSPKGILASHYIITVDLKEKKVRYEDASEGSDTDSCEEATCTFFVKCLPQIEFAIRYCQDLGVYLKECRLYQQLIPRLQDVGIGHTPWAAHCYIAEEGRLIVLENLNENGFIGLESREIDLEHLHVAMKVLARMHASSIALEMRTRQNIPDLYPGLLDENGYPETEGLRRRGVALMTQTILELSKLLPGYDDWDHNEIVEAFPGVINQIYELVKPSETLQNVFSQSDFWVNNILFKYDTQIQNVDGTTVSAVKQVPVDARLVDYQFSRYAPPAYDIAIMMYNATNSEFRKEHTQEVLESYYLALDEEISMYGFVLEDIIPRQAFEQSYETFKLAGLIENLMFNSVIFLPEDFWKEITVSSDTFEEYITKTHTKISLEAFDQYPMFKNKMEELLKEIIENYVLKPEWNQRL